MPFQSSLEAHLAKLMIFESSPQSVQRIWAHCANSMPFGSTPWHYLHDPSIGPPVNLQLFCIMISPPHDSMSFRSGVWRVWSTPCQIDAVQIQSPRQHLTHSKTSKQALVGRFLILHCLPSILPFFGITASTPFHFSEEVTQWFEPVQCGDSSPGHQPHLWPGNCFVDVV